MPSEFSLIETFLRQFRGASSRVHPVVGPGDDCAVLPSFRGDLCVTTDQVVQGIHFLIPGFSLEEVGHKALAVNLSDLAAMGAQPRWFVCAIACPKSVRTQDIRALGRGMARLAKRHGALLVGGNFTSAQELSITITAAGEVPRGKALRRDGARAGDLLYVSGTLGGARWGVELLAQRSAKKRSPAMREALVRQKAPEPRIKLGLLARRFAHAAIDISDGLTQDLGHVLERSKLDVQLAHETLPLAPGLLAIMESRRTGLRAARWRGLRAFTGGAEGPRAGV